MVTISRQERIEFDIQVVIESQADKESPYEGSEIELQRESGSRFHSLFCIKAQLNDS